jgi:hypothetical protein
VANNDFKYLYPLLTDFEIRYYMMELLKVHIKGEGVLYLGKSGIGTGA